MDMGNYERFLNQKIPKSNNITTPQIYSSVIEAERKGEYLGACVQIIPHVTDEIKNRIRNISEITGRTHRIYRKLRIFRIASRNLASKCKIPGMTKSSW